MADPSDVTRWVGASVAVVGAFAVSPDGDRLAIRAVLSAVRRPVLTGRARLVRLLPFLRAKPRMVGVGAYDVFHMTDSVSVSVVRNWADGEGVDQRVERLRLYVEGLFSALESMEVRLGHRLTEHDSEFVAVRRLITEGLDEVSTRLDESERRAAAIDARALPVVGFGVVLTALPDELSALPGPVWLGVLVVACGFALAVATVALRERRAWS